MYAHGVLYELVQMKHQISIRKVTLHKSCIHIAKLDFSHMHQKFAGITAVCQEFIGQDR